jgi:hypothetical protein
MYCTALPYSSTLFPSGVGSAYAVRELSKGQAHIVALLSVAAGISLVAVIQFSWGMPLCLYHKTQFCRSALPTGMNGH